MPRTHYQVLGVERAASSTEIEAAFREHMAAFKDRTYAGTDTIEDVREAFRVLSNVPMRVGYDETLPVERVARPQKSSLPGWVKWALPFVLVAGCIAWIAMHFNRPREITMTVRSITKLPAEEAPDPRRLRR